MLHGWICKQICWKDGDIAKDGCTEGCGGHYSMSCHKRRTVESGEVKEKKAIE